MRSTRVSDLRSGRAATVAARKRWRLQPTLMPLEDRRLMSTIVVNNPTDIRRRWQDRPAPGDRPGEYDGRGRDDHL